ncbi:hypothetical protein [uncultured Roseovarius sp.]|uniref:hypothetical protein n=1 Tax=uncultured Roseovarius sp. TaxID=293344 RepID=UPI00260C380E|nr:hypothetical protein [uncultured Roseovarius sp.]
MKKLSLLLFGCLMAPAAWADGPTIIDVTIKKIGMVWRVDVTLEHGDTGWDHYADGWEVLDANGNRLAHRELMHPHVNEQPFTRALSGVVFPDGTREVFVRAKCSVDGWSGEKTRVELKP